jgi:hypothetical protein
MSTRTNSIVHFISALYAAIIVGSLIVLVPQSFILSIEVRIWLGAGVFFLVVDGIAGFLQWRNPLASQELSIGLHLAFSAVATALVTFSYLQDRPPHFIRWLSNSDFGFLLLLAFIRLLVGGVLLRDKERSRPVGDAIQRS